METVLASATGFHVQFDHDGLVRLFQIRLALGRETVVLLQRRSGVRPAARPWYAAFHDLEPRTPLGDLTAGFFSICAPPSSSTCSPAPFQYCSMALSADTSCAGSFISLTRPLTVASWTAAPSAETLSLLARSRRPAGLPATIGGANWRRTRTACMSILRPPPQKPLISMQFTYSNARPPCNPTRKHHGRAT